MVQKIVQSTGQNWKEIHSRMELCLDWSGIKDCTKEERIPNSGRKDVHNSYVKLFNIIKNNEFLSLKRNQCENLNWKARSHTHQIYQMRSERERKVFMRSGAHGQAAQGNRLESPNGKSQHHDSSDVCAFTSEESVKIISLQTGSKFLSQNLSCRT